MGLLYQYVRVTNDHYVRAIQDCRQSMWIAGNRVDCFCNPCGFPAILWIAFAILEVCRQSWGLLFASLIALIGRNYYGGLLYEYVRIQKGRYIMAIQDCRKSTGLLWQST